MACPGWPWDLTEICVADYAYDWFPTGQVDNLDAVVGINPLKRREHRITTLAGTLAQAQG
ncbi:MAG: hypothetical protein IPG06_22920 [Haliea sp.]|nr:hypothetical protein [Haliea sp.]